MQFLRGAQVMSSDKGLIKNENLDLKKNEEKY